MALRIEVNGRSFPVALSETPAAQALLARLPMTVRMAELNGNEKYCSLPAPLPADPQRLGSIRAGDLMLFGTDCLVLFYESFPTRYRYTPLGRVTDPDGLAEALGSGDPTVVFLPEK